MKVPLPGEEPGHNAPPTDMAWDLYIIRTHSGKLYTGITTDLERRLEQHRSGEGGAKFFRTSAPEVLVYQERHATRSAATRREIEIKRMKRTQKLALIEERSVRPKS